MQWYRVAFDWTDTFRTERVPTVVWVCADSTDEACKIVRLTLSYGIYDPRDMQVELVTDPKILDRLEKKISSLSDPDKHTILYEHKD